MNDVYYRYSLFLKRKYGSKVYKLPVSLPATCPNRDGCTSFGGCTYCGEGGAGFELLSGSIPVWKQIEINKAHIEKKFKACKFIAYFQNYSNTYMPLDQFKNYITEAAQCENIVEIAIATRPDCINDKYIEFLRDFKSKKGINITVELGLQTPNYRTLIKINRGHTLAEYIDAAIQIKNNGIDLCTHVILNLPDDDLTDVIESAKITSALKSDHIKLHALYIMKDTIMAKQYAAGEISIINIDEYKERVKTFLEYLSPNTSVQRLIGRAPKKDSLFVNWGVSWWKIRDDIEAEMKEQERFQGRLFNYLNGSAIRRIQ